MLLLLGQWRRPSTSSSLPRVGAAAGCVAPGRSTSGSPYEQGGLPALADRSTAHAGVHTKISAELEALICDPHGTRLTWEDNSTIFESMYTEQLTRRAKQHACLSDPHRLAIVDELAISDRSPSEVAEMLGLPSNLVAHHLKVLEDVGLVIRISSHGDHRRRYIRLRRAALGGMPMPLVLRAQSVLFVCTANSARSQLAAGAWNQRHRVRAESAGTHPADRIHSKAIAAAKRVGIDLKGARPHPLAPNDLEAPALVVTVCDRAHEDLAKAGELGLLHWSIPDPAVVGTNKAFDKAATEILDRVDELVPLVSSNLD